MCLSWRILMKSSQVHLSWRRLQSLWCWCWLRDVRWDLWGLQCGIGFGSMGSIQYTQECQHHHEAHIICTGMWCGLIMIMRYHEYLAIKFNLSNGNGSIHNPQIFGTPSLPIWFSDNSTDLQTWYFSANCLWVMAVWWLGLAVYYSRQIPR